MDYEEIICDANNLYRAYKVSVKTSKWKETTQKFMMNFLRYIFSIQDDLMNRTLQNGPTQEFTLFERGRVRPITSIQIRDRIIRHVLCDEVLLPEVKKHIIYDNCASIKGRGISHQRDRFEVHLRKYYRLYGNEGWILFGDFSKFYDNIIHEIAKRELLKLFNDDEFIDWLLTQIFDGFKIDVSYMTDEEYARCMSDTFNKLEYRKIPESTLTGEKWMEKSVNIGDQLSQVIGIYYPYRIDNYVKYVRSQKFYGRYMDDWYIMNPSKEELLDLLDNIHRIAEGDAKMEPWFQMVATIVCAVIASSGFWAYIQKRGEKKDVKTQMLIGLAHDRIVYLGMCYIERGWITQDEYENLNDYLYKPYEKMGGNGSAQKIMLEVNKLPIHKSTYVEEN